MASIVSAGTTTATALNMSADTSGVLQLASNNGTVAVTVDTSQNVGVGVTPSAWYTSSKALQIGTFGIEGRASGSISNISTNSYINSAGSAYIYITSDYATRYQQANGAHNWFTAASGTAGNAITFTQAMTLDSSGNLLVGTTATGGSQTQGVVLVTGTAAEVDVGHASGTVSGATYMAFRYNGGAIGTVTQNGTTAVLYNTTSDQRLKENIQDAAPASELIDALQVRQFDWKTDNSHQRYGFVAQELVTVAPEAVHQPADADDMMAVDYSKLVPMLVKEIQSLRARVAQLENK